MITKHYDVSFRIIIVNLIGIGKSTADQSYRFHFLLLKVFNLAFCGLGQRKILGSAHLVLLEIHVSFCFILIMQVIFNVYMQRSQSNIIHHFLPLVLLFHFCCFIGSGFFILLMIKS